MDDIRRPYRGERRDYALPQHRPSPPSDLRPARPAPSPVPRVHHPAPDSHNHQPPQPAVHHTPPIHSRPVQHHTPQHQPIRHTAARAKRRRLPKLSLNKPVVLATILAGAAIFGGYLLLKPDKQKVFTPASLAKQSSFSFYYPSPLPAGYAYVNNINTFQDGQAYYMLGKGNKHIIVHEQSASGSKLDTSSLSDPVNFTAAGGQAALGNVAGQPSGLVLTGSTFITLNTTGGVSPADLAALVNNLKPVNR